MLTAREQRQLYDRLVDKAGKDMADKFLRAMQAAASNVSVADLAAAIDAGDLQRIEALLNIQQGTLFPLSEALRSAYVQGGLSAARIVGGVFAFDGGNPRAQAFMASQGAELVTRIQTEQRDMLRAVLDERIASGESGTKTARKIVGKVNPATGRREGGFIGLTGPQTQWAINAETQLRNLDAGYFQRVQRDRRFDTLVRKAIKDGKPLSEADVQRITGRYRDRLLKQRGEVIARTEAHIAQSAAQYEGMRQLVEAGETVTLKWIHGFSKEPRMDHVAAALSPPRPLGVPFVMGDGTPLLYPHEPGAPADHVIGCKCSIFYRLIR